MTYCYDKSEIDTRSENELSKMFCYQEFLKFEWNNALSIWKIRQTWESELTDDTFMKMNAEKNEKKIIDPNIWSKTIYRNIDDEISYNDTVWKRYCYFHFHDGDNGLRWTPKMMLNVCLNYKKEKRNHHLSRIKKTLWETLFFRSWNAEVLNGIIAAKCSL